MDFGASLAQSFALLFSPVGLLPLVIGLMIGIMVGFLPGITPLGGLALVILLVAPLQAIAFKEPTGLTALGGAVFIVAFVYGTLYGRTFAAINLQASELGSLDSRDLPARSLMIWGLIAGVVVAVTAGVIAATWKPYLGPVERASMVAFILLAGSAFSSGSPASGLAIAVLGLLLSLVGSDLETGAQRLTFGLPELANGISILNAAVGLFVVASAIYSLDQAGAVAKRPMAAPETALPSSILKSMLGVPAGLLPTNGAAVTKSIHERRTQPDADIFDPVSQTNMRDIVCATITSDLRLSISLIPIFTLIIGFDVVTILLPIVAFFGGGDLQPVMRFAALTTKAWLVCSTLILLHVVPLLMVLFWKHFRWRHITIDVLIVAPLTIACCCAIGYFSRNSIADIGVMLAFGAVGYFMILANLDRSLLFLGLVLGLHFEEMVRMAMLIARGDATVFVTRPISAGVLALGLILFAAGLVWRAYRKREVHRAVA